jgi:hypothetical protein
MNLEKCYLLGEAASKFCDYHQPDLSIIDRPPGAINTFIGIGILLLALETKPTPGTLAELRDRVRSYDLAPQNVKSASQAIIFLLDDGIIDLNELRQLTFTPPDSPTYREVLEMPD